MRFACVRRSGVVSAIAHGTLSRDLLVIASVATRSELRRQGLARRVVSALMGWAAPAGVMEACLQVMSDNTPTRALYDQLGFSTELYSYHYRRAAALRQA